LRESLSKTGAVVGTIGYLAPEQAADSKHVGPAADVFALAAILYECLAGERAFEGETALETLAKLASGSHTPLRVLRPETPRWLEATLERALEADPRRRLADGATLARAIEAG